MNRTIIKIRIMQSLPASFVCLHERLYGEHLGAIGLRSDLSQQVLGDIIRELREARLVGISAAEPLEFRLTAEGATHLKAQAKSGTDSLQPSRG